MDNDDDNLMMVIMRMRMRMRMRITITINFKSYGAVSMTLALIQEANYSIKYCIYLNVRLL